MSRRFIIALLIPVSRRRAGRRGVPPVGEDRLEEGTVHGVSRRGDDKFAGVRGRENDWMGLFAKVFLGHCAEIRHLFAGEDVTPVFSVIEEPGTRRACTWRRLLRCPTAAKPG